MSLTEKQEKAGLRVALVTIDYPPVRTSAAVQMRDLAREFADRGHRPAIIVPVTGLTRAWQFDHEDGVDVLRVSASPMRDIGYLRRTLNESVVWLTLIRGLAASPLGKENWDLVAWYSPTIFFGPLIGYIKRRSNALTYLILRDIFPEWAVDLGIMRKGLIYWYFKLVALYQYRVADVIGVQTKSNLSYLENWATARGKRLEVLRNWQHPPKVGPCSIDLLQTPLRGRKIFCYIGNMGRAQHIDILLDLAEKALPRKDIGFAFVGRGSEAAALRQSAILRQLENVAFFEEIPAEEIPGFLEQCYAGLLALHPKHKSHNIPGKFLSYLRANLPVVAYVNHGTDLLHMIEDSGVGRAFSGDALDDLLATTLCMADDLELHQRMSRNGKELAEALFSPRATVDQILGHLPVST